MNKSSKENLARFGIATKGFVYCLIGGLTLMAAVGWGGTKGGGSEAFQKLAQEPFGQFLLIITGLGLIAFVFWRMYQAFADPEHKGDDFQGMVRRAGYFFSGSFYSVLAYTAIRIGSGSGAGSGGGKETLVAKLLSMENGQILVGVLGAIFLGKAIYQLYRAYSGKFKSKVDAARLGIKARKVVLTSGKIGYTCRGIVIGIISFLTFRAAVYADSSEAGGTKDAFSFIQSEFGTLVLALIAIGLFAYGVFMFIKSRYRRMALT